MKALNFLKSRIILSIFCCFRTFVNKLFIYLLCAYLKKQQVLNVKSLTYYFHMKTKILANFQISISFPLRISSINVIKPQFPVALVTFTEETLMKNFIFCAKTGKYGPGKTQYLDTHLGIYQRFQKSKFDKTLVFFKMRQSKI